MTNQEEAQPEIPPLADPGGFLHRVSQVQWDHYYMRVAETVRTRANCLGTDVGAVLVRGNRIVSTGFNGTPAGFDNCLDGGCVRCRDRYLGEIGRSDIASDKQLARGGPKRLDECICVHAEANAMLSGARFGNSTDGACMYTTSSPCFSCLKEAIQAGVKRIVYLREWVPSESRSLKQQYLLLAEHLRQTDQRNFERLAHQRDLIEGTGTAARDPNLDELIDQELAKEQAKAQLKAKEEEAKRTKRRRQRAARESGKSGGATRSGR